MAIEFAYNPTSKPKKHRNGKSVNVSGRKFTLPVEGIPTDTEGEILQMQIAATNGQNLENVSLPPLFETYMDIERTK